MHTVAIVGCGHIHIKDIIDVLKNRSEVTVPLVWDSQPHRALRVASALGSEIATDLSSIWNSQSVEAIIIASETVSHESLLLAAAAAGKAIFVEKPLTTDAASAARVAAAIETAGVLFHTGFFMRDLPVYREMRRLICEGTFGDLTRIEATLCHSGVLDGWFDDCNWMLDPAQAGCGGFGDLGIHLIDLLLWLVGPAIAVTAAVGGYPVNASGGRFSDHYGQGLLRFANGTIGSITAGRTDPANAHTLLVSGTKGILRIEDGKLLGTAKILQEITKVLGNQTRQIAAGDALHTFLNALAGIPAALVTPSEAASRDIIMHAMYEAATRETWVQI